MRPGLRAQIAAERYRRAIGSPAKISARQVDPAGDQLLRTPLPYRHCRAALALDSGRWFCLLYPVVHLNPSALTYEIWRMRLLLPLSGRVFPGISLPLWRALTGL